MESVPFTWVFWHEMSRRKGQNFTAKAECCLGGDRQLAYVDYYPFNVYAPLASHDSICLLPSMASNHDLLLEGADISNACLYGDLNVPLFIEHPTKSTQREQIHSHVHRLNNSLYRSTQAGEIWVPTRQITEISWSPKLKLRPLNLFLLGK